MKILRVGIASYDAFKERTMKIARGELKPGADDPKLWFISLESFAKVLSDKNRALLAEIRASRPQSLAELAARTGRKTSNLSRTLKKMEMLGLIRLHKGPRGRLVPEVPFEEIVLTLPLEGENGRKPKAA